MIKILPITILLLASMPTLAVGAKESPQAIKALEIYKTIIEIPTIAGRGKVPEMAAYLAKEFREVDFKDEYIRIIPSGETIGMIVRYQGDGTIDKSILLLSHMDVVEALDIDWDALLLSSLKMTNILRPRQNREVNGGQGQLNSYSPVNLSFSEGGLAGRPIFLSLILLTVKASITCLNYSLSMAIPLFELKRIATSNLPSKF
jgi:hypothetical protein